MALQTKVPESIVYNNKSHFGKRCSDLFVDASVDGYTTQHEVHSGEVKHHIHLVVVLSFLIPYLKGQQGLQLYTI